MDEAELPQAIDRDFVFDSSDEKCDGAIFAHGDKEDATGIIGAGGEPAAVALLGMGKESVLGRVPFFVKRQVLATIGRTPGTSAAVAGRISMSLIESYPQNQDVAVAWMIRWPEALTALGRRGKSWIAGP